MLFSLLRPVLSESSQIKSQQACIPVMQKSRPPEISSRIPPHSGQQPRRFCKEKRQSHSRHTLTADTFFTASSAPSATVPSANISKHPTNVWGSTAVSTPTFKHIFVTFFTLKRRASSSTRGIKAPIIAASCIR